MRSAPLTAPHRLYFIPTPTAQPADSAATASTLIAALETLFPTLTRAAPWTLTYRLFRDTAPRADPSDTPAPHAHTYQHVLTHTALGPQRAYVYVAPPATAGSQSENKTPSITSIPASQSDSLAALLRHQLAALWTPRHVLSVANGALYTGGLFTIHIGELRAQREGHGGGASSPGVVVSIATTAGAEEDGGEDVAGQQNGTETGDFEAARAAVRELWGTIRAGRELGRGEVREVFMVPGGGSARDETDAVVRMWCEVLRLRG